MSDFVDPHQVQMLEAEIRHLEERIDEERQAVQRTNRTALSFALVLAAIVVGFLLVNYVNVRAELTPEKFSQSIERELQEVGPVAIKEFGQLGQDLLPIYLQEWKRQLEASWPEIRQQLREEFLRLGDDLTATIHELLAASETRVIERTGDIVAGSYPDLASGQRREELERRLHEVCSRSLEKTLVRFDEMFSKDVERLQTTLLKFDVSDTEESTIDLQKKFLRLWLQLLDQEIMKI